MIGEVLLLSTVAGCSAGYGEARGGGVAGSRECGRWWWWWWGAPSGPADYRMSILYRNTLCWLLSKFMTSTSQILTTDAIYAYL